MINTIIYELAEELVDPSEAVLDDQIEEVLDTEEEVILGVSDDDDAVIDFIAKGKRITNADPIDFTDYDVDEVIEDDEEDE